MGKIIFLIMSEYRELTEQEQQLVLEQRRGRTSAEREAYRLLPECMKQCVERNSPVAFDGHSAFYPDFLFREAKIIIEIDGDIHRFEPQRSIDIHRDSVFRNHGFDVIRIWNDDVWVLAFWQSLKEKLSEVNPTGIKAVVLDYINELDVQINQLKEGCKKIHNDKEEYVFFPKSPCWRIYNTQALHEVFMC